jgi:hypothetical protein
LVPAPAAASKCASSEPSAMAIAADRARPMPAAPHLAHPADGSSAAPAAATAGCGLAAGPGAGAANAALRLEVGTRGTGPCAGVGAATAAYAATFWAAGEYGGMGA